MDGWMDVVDVIEVPYSLHWHQLFGINIPK